ncbi:MAG: Ig-like domain repeat protein, partial [Nocardioidaceae bacterium]
TVGALALGTVGALAAVGAANAADATQTSAYTCSLTAPFGDQDLPISSTLTLPDSVPAGTDVSGLPVAMGVDLSSIAAGLAGAGLTPLSGQVSNISFPIVGTKKVIPVGAVDAPAVDLTQVTSLAGTAATGTFRAPAPGSYDIALPTSLTFLPMVGGNPIGNVPCTLKDGEPTTLDTALKVVKAPSTTTAKLANTPTTAKPAKLAVAVKRAGIKASGKVVATQNGKTVGAGTLSKSGTATLTLSKMTKGTKTVVVSYKGDTMTKKSSKSVTFTVRKG